MLWTTTWNELVKRYAESYFGFFWIALQPLLFLGVYLFVYLVVFKVRFPGYSELDYVLYVFAGLVPYIAFMEAVSQGTICIKQNIHLIKNVIVPIDLIPARVVVTSLVSQCAGLVMVMILSAINESLSANLLFLPMAILLQVLFFVGLVWLLSAIGLIIPDFSYFVNILLLLLLFLSPIAFTPDMAHGKLSILVDYNPIYYMTELFRFSLVADYPANHLVLGIAVSGSVVIFVLGSIFFRRFRNVLVDYE